MPDSADTKPSRLSKMRVRKGFVLVILGLALCAGIVIGGYQVFDIYLDHRFKNAATKYNIEFLDIEIDGSESVTRPKIRARVTYRNVSGTHIFSIEDIFGVPDDQVDAVDVSYLGGAIPERVELKTHGYRKLGAECPLPRALSEGETVDITFEYACPYAFNVKGGVIPVPVLSGQRFYAQRVSVRVKKSEKYPELWVVAPGRLMSIEEDENTKTFTWESLHVPFGVWVIIERFSLFKRGLADGIELDVFLAPPKDSSDFLRQEELADSTLDVFERVYLACKNRFGPLGTKDDTLTWAKLALLQPTKRIRGPYTFSSVSVLTPRNLELLDRPPELIIEGLATEISHSWWGGNLRAQGKPRRWHISDKSWIPEGFANYSALMCIEDILGEEALKTRILSTLRILNTPLPPGHPMHAKGISPNPKARSIFDEGIMRQAYTVAFMLRTLRYVLGTEQFYRTMRRLLDEYRYHAIWVDEFVDLFQSENADVDLGWFFDMFFRTSDYKRVDYQITDIEVAELDEPLGNAHGVTRRHRLTFVVSDRGLVQQAIRRDRKTGVLPVGIEIEVKTSDRNEVVRMTGIRPDESGMRAIELETSAPLDSILLDPDMWLVGVDQDYSNNWIAVPSPNRTKE